MDSEYPRGKADRSLGGAQRRDYLYVDDAVDAFLLAGTLAAPTGRVYNVGGSEVLTLAETAQLMVRICGGGQIVTRDFPEERAKIDIGDYFTDDSLFRRTVHWSPCISFEAGMAETLAFYRHNLSRYV